MFEQLIQNSTEEIEIPDFPIPDNFFSIQFWLG